jgi:hypothetical protein
MSSIIETRRVVIGLSAAESSAIELVVSIFFSLLPLAAYPVPPCLPEDDYVWPDTAYYRKY